MSRPVEDKVGENDVPATPASIQDRIAAGPSRAEGCIAARATVEGVRELSDEAIRHQADALEAYVRKGGSAARWVASRDYSPADLDALARELERRTTTMRSA